jgi:hypothetical protein
MTIRRWAYLIGILVVCAIAGGGWIIYSRKCHGVDACAAQSAEGHERDVPKGTAIAWLFPMTLS